MDKRYQVFLSSTYTDLKEERQEVISALIKRKCFPIAMEYFPAMSRKSIDYIKDAIRECDFYILIIAGRYGSSKDENGVSLTEIEFDYAQELKIPTNIYMYDGPALPSDKIEATDEGKNRLQNFIEKLRNTELGYATWTNKDNLASAVKDGIEELKSSTSAVGWIRADKTTSIYADKTNNHLQKILDSTQKFHIEIFRKNTLTQEERDFWGQICRIRTQGLYRAAEVSLCDIFPHIVRTAFAVQANRAEQFDKAIMRSVLGTNESLNSLFLGKGIAEEIIGEAIVQGLLQYDNGIFKVSSLGSALFDIIANYKNTSPN